VDGGDHGYLQAEGGPYQYQERADYWSMTQIDEPLEYPGRRPGTISNRWRPPATRLCLAVYADARPDGKLSLLVVNKSPENEVKARRFYGSAGSSPTAKAESLVVRFHVTTKWNTDKEPFHADPDLPHLRRAYAEETSRKRIQIHLHALFHHGAPTGTKKPMSTCFDGDKKNKDAR
jgi:hypothetical protein